MEEALVTTAFTSLTAEELSEEELGEYREIFNLVDRDGGGSISNEELGELMDTLGINASQEEIDLMINEIDQDSNGEIDFEEFVAVMSRRVNAKYTPAQVRSAFKVFEDPNIAGCIKPEALEKSILESLPTDAINKDQLHQLISQLEVDIRGNFHFVDYINMMMS